MSVTVFQIDAYQKYALAQAESINSMIKALLLSSARFYEATRYCDACRANFDKLVKDGWKGQPINPCKQGIEPDQRD